MFHSEGEAPMSLRSVLLDRQLAMNALGIATPMIEALLQLSKREGPNFVHVVVMDPFAPTHGGFTVIAQRTIGPAPEDHSQWKRRYDAIALAKAAVSQRTGKSSAVAIAEAPALLQVNDTFFEGSDVIGGVPVGASWVESYLDEAAARIVGSVISALIKERLDDLKEKGKVFLEPS